MSCRKLMSRLCLLYSSQSGNDASRDKRFSVINFPTVSIAFLPMTDLLHTIPDFPTKLYTHLLPSLEKHLITTTDLLTLDALEVAKRAQLPLLDVRRLANHVVTLLQGQLGLQNYNSSSLDNVGEGRSDYGALKRTGKECMESGSTISTLDPAIDVALGDGIPTGYVTEITGER